MHAYALAKSWAQVRPSMSEIPENKKEIHLLPLSSHSHYRLQKLRSINLLCKLPRSSLSSDWPPPRRSSQDPLMNRRSNTLWPWCNILLKHSVIFTVLPFVVKCVFSNLPTKIHSHLNVFIILDQKGLHVFVEVMPININWIDVLKDNVVKMKGKLYFSPFIFWILICRPRIWMCIIVYFMESPQRKCTLRKDVKVDKSSKDTK